MNIQPPPKLHTRVGTELLETESVNFYKLAHIDQSRVELDAPTRITAYSSNSSNIPETFDNSSYPDEFSPTTNKDADPGYRRASRIFLAVSIASTLSVLVLECFMYAVINIHKKIFDSNEKYSEISIYLSLFIFASVYQILLTIIGLKTKNMLLLAMLCGFYCAMLIYTGIQYQELSGTVIASLPSSWQKATRGTNIAAICVIAVTLVVQAYMIFFVLRKNVKWFRYKKIGADLKIKRMYTMFQVHRCLLIFDFFFFLAFTVQFIVIMVADRSSVEFILTVCVLPLTIILLLASDFAATREYIWLSCTTILFFAGGCAYVLFKVIRLYTKYTAAYNVGLHPGGYFPGRKSLVLFGVVTLILLITTIAVEIMLVVNYGKGLLPLVNTYYHRHREEEEETFLPEKDTSLLIID